MLFGLGFFAVPAFVRLPPVKTSLTSKVLRVDWIGACLVIGGLAVFIIGISWADIQFGWLSAQTLVPVAIGLLLLGAGIIWEMWGAKTPMMQESVFSTWSINILYACAFCHGLIVSLTKFLHHKDETVRWLTSCAKLLCALIYVPFYFTAVLFKSPLRTALGLFPMLITLIPGTLLVAFLAPRIGSFRWAIWVGWAITAGSSGLLLLFNDKSSTPVCIAILSLFGFGNGMVLTGLNIGIANYSKAEDRPRALAMYAFFRTLGLSVGVAAAGNVFRVTLSAGLKEVNLPGGIAYHAETVSGRVAKLPIDEPVRAEAIAAFLRGFHGVFWFMLATALLALLLSAIVKSSSSSNKGLDGFKFPWRPDEEARFSERETIKSDDVDGPQITVMLAPEDRPTPPGTATPKWTAGRNSPRVPTPASAGSLRFPSGLTMTPCEPATAVLAWPDGRPVPNDACYRGLVWGKGGLLPDDVDLNRQKRAVEAEWV